ncbi:hypothetical protein M513_05082 [Trichuris suis]|uniref:Uncharacterized protein n=1 Tax=Trichuris suis TaxID=68888 RepID=A0A085MA17_9BILA|nr:hypothetical protein M513_05082 [Trichuris suis]
MGRSMRFVNRNTPLWYFKFKQRSNVKAKKIQERLESFSASNFNMRNMAAFRKKASTLNSIEEAGTWVFGVENIGRVLASKHYVVRSIFLELGKCTKEEKQFLSQVNKMARQYDADVSVVAENALAAATGSNMHEGLCAQVIPVTAEESPMWQCGFTETAAETDGQFKKSMSSYFSNKSS